MQQPTLKSRLIQTFVRRKCVFGVVELKESCTERFTSRLRNGQMALVYTSISREMSREGFRGCDKCKISYEKTAGGEDELFVCG